MCPWGFGSKRENKYREHSSHQMGCTFKSLDPLSQQCLILKNGFPLKNCPLWGHNFYTYELLPLPCHVKAFHLMAEMALLHSAFPGRPFRKCQKASRCCRHDWSCHAVPVGFAIALAAECAHTHTENTKGLCDWCVCVCEYTCLCLQA